MALQLGGYILLNKMVNKNIVNFTVQLDHELLVKEHSATIQFRMCCTDCIYLKSQPKHIWII